MIPIGASATTSAREHPDGFVAFDTARLPVVLEAVDDDLLIEGVPTVGTVALGRLGSAEFGVWEMTTGAMRDIEVDEVFLVIDGAASLELRTNGHATAQLELRPGMLVRLDAGMTTVWSVPVRLRKLYLVESDHA